MYLSLIFFNNYLPTGENRKKDKYINPFLLFQIYLLAKRIGKTSNKGNSQFELSVLHLVNFPFSISYLTSLKLKSHDLKDYKSIFKLQFENLH